MKTGLAIAMIAAALSAGPAHAEAYPPWVLAVRDCADDGKLDRTYPHGALQEALQHLPSDGDEYSDCANMIRRALTGGSGSTMTPPPNAVVAPSGAIAATNDDIAQLEAVIAAAETGEPAAVQNPTGQIPSKSRVIRIDAALADLDARSGVPYRPDFGLIAAIISAGLVAISVAATRARRRAAA